MQDVPTGCRCLQRCCHAIGLPLACFAPRAPGTSVEQLEHAKGPVWCCRWVLESKLECTFRQMGQPGRTQCGKYHPLLSTVRILTTHQKDSSQETVISLLGMLAGSVVVSYVSSPISTWTCLVLLLSIHLAMNRAAVRAVTMHSLNRQRANLVTSTLIDQDRIMTPQEVSMQERIFEWDGVLRWRSSSPFAAARIGLSLRELLASLAPAHERTGSIRDTEARLTRLIRLYGQEEFLVWYDAPERLGHITLKEGAAAESQLKAWVLVLWTAHRHHAAGADATGAVFETSLEVHRRTLQELSSRWSDYSSRLRSAGWDLDIASLETRPGSRVRLPARTGSSRQ
ncbi:hypothetical protein XANCAGTX0491_004669 [Xanthoria calcicola]